MVVMAPQNKETKSSPTNKEVAPEHDRSRHPRPGSSAETLEGCLESLRKMYKDGGPEKNIKAFLEVRQTLHLLVETSGYNGLSTAQLGQARDLSRTADSMWSLHKAQELIVANQRLDDLTAPFNSKLGAEYEARKDYRQKLLSVLATLPPEKITASALSDAVKALGGENTAGYKSVTRFDDTIAAEFRRVGMVDWRNAMDKEGISPSAMRISRDEWDKSGRYPDQMVDFNKNGSQIGSPRQLAAELERSTVLGPGIVIRAMAFKERDNNVNTAMLPGALQTLSDALREDKWVAVANPLVREKYHKLQEGLTAELQQRLEKDKDPKHQEQFLVEFSRKLLTEQFDFVKGMRAAGQLQLTANGESAFRQMSGILDGTDERLRGWNKSLDFLSEQAVFLALSGGAANIVRAAVSAPLRSLLTQEFGEEVLKVGIKEGLKVLPAKQIAARLGVHLAELGAETVAFRTTMSGLEYASGDKTAYQDFGQKLLRDAGMFTVVGGAAKLVAKGFSEFFVAPEALAEAQAMAVGSTKGEVERALLQKALENAPGLKALYHGSTIGAEGVLFAVQGIAEKLKAGQISVADLSKAETWQSAMSESFTTVVALKLGQKATAPLAEAAGRASEHAGEAMRPEAIAARARQIRAELLAAARAVEPEGARDRLREAGVGQRRQSVMMYSGIPVQELEALGPYIKQPRLFLDKLGVTASEFLKDSAKVAHWVEETASKYRDHPEARDLAEKTVAAIMLDGTTYGQASTPYQVRGPLERLLTAIEGSNLSGRDYTPVREAVADLAKADPQTLSERLNKVANAVNQALVGKAEGPDRETALALRDLVATLQNPHYIRRNPADTLTVATRMASTFAAPARFVSEAPEPVSAFLKTKLSMEGPSNQGNNGVIYRLNPQLVNEPAIREGFQQMGIPLSQDSAVKILKLGSPGDIESEMKNQELARSLLRDAGVTAVEVPQAYRAFRIPLSEGDLAAVRARNITPGYDENGKPYICAMAMDYVQGYDVNYVLGRKIIEVENAKRKARLEQIEKTQGKIPDYQAQQFDPIEIPASGDVDGMKRAVAMIIPRVELSAKRRDESSQNHAQMQIDNQNAESWYRYLQAAGVRMHPQVVQAIEGALRVFERNGLHHNDLHERNIMIGGDPEAMFVEAGKDNKAPQVYMIDFDNFGPRAEGEVRARGHETVGRLLRKYLLDAN